MIGRPLTQWAGNWSVNNGNTFGGVYYANTRRGLLRILGRIIDGNITRPGEIGTANIFAPGESVYDSIPETLYRRNGVWYDKRF